ncbi:MAG: DUF1565 domain-containing protein [Anaerolineales bacterium]|nr:DUF1565 domain-containing protein [Anaerolineales bacterium]
MKIMRVLFSILHLALLTNLIFVLDGSADAGVEVVWAPRTIQASEAGCVLYVSTDGSDENVGTEQLPLRTIQHAADIAIAGDVICVYPGSYGERIVITRSGVFGQRIRFRSLGGAVTRGFTILANHIAVENFEVTNTLDDWRDAHGIFLEGTNLVIIDNFVHHVRGDGITCYHHEPYCNDSLIADNIVAYADGTGVRIFGQGNTVERNDISHSVNALGGDADGIRFFGSDQIIRGNFIHDITNDEAPSAHTDCFQTFDNSKPPTNDILIEGNVCINVDHQCMMASAETKRQSSGITFRNNICDNNGGQAINVLQIPNVTIVNNTFSENILYRAVILRDQAHHATILNNIFFGSYFHYEVDESSLSGLTADYNLKYPASWRMWVEPHGIWDVDPQFVDSTSKDFHLQSTSPAIDHGITLSEVVVDLEGVPRPQGYGYDIGAYEYAEAAFMAEDLNLDGSVDVLDVSLCVNVILELEKDAGILVRANVNRDLKVDVQDVQQIINAIDSEGVGESNYRR